MSKQFLLTLLTSTLVMACGHGDDPIDDNELEVITTIELTFTPEAGGAPVVAVFDDADGNGGDPPTIDAIDLSVGTYTLAVRFENRLEEPPEDITAEVADESEEHQVFFTGSAVDGPASNNPGAALLHSYDDQDTSGLPVGLVNKVVADVGNGDLVVTLRHLPPVGGRTTKTAELNATVLEMGLAGIGGSSDASVSFAVKVE